MCAKKAQLIKETKERMQEIHISTMNKLEECIQVIQPVKVKANAVSR